MGGHPAHWNCPALGIELDQTLGSLPPLLTKNQSPEWATVTCVTQQGK